MRLPICKKCKQFLCIEFHDYMNLSIDCQCSNINRISIKEFENEFLFEKKAKKDELKDEYNSDNKLIKIVPFYMEESNESNSKTKLESNEKTINTQLISNDQRENNESLLKKNLKGNNKIINTDVKEIEEINDNLSNETYETYNDLEEKERIENYIDIKEEDLCKCIIHNKKEFIKYCFDCRSDLCFECLNMESDLYSNTIIKNKKHENHTKISLEEIKDKFHEIDLLMEKTKNNEKVYKTNQPNLIKIFKIIKCYMNNYEKYKCYNLYKSIENMKTFLEKINDKEPKFNNFEVDYKNYIKIKSEEELLKRIVVSYNISSIDIQNKGKINMSIFHKRDFRYLEELILIGNNIKDISSLSTNTFPHLKILNLEKNELDSSVIQILKELKMPELIELILYKNKITDIKIFD